MVMKLLGAKYPSSQEDFKKSNLSGEWEPSLSGQRMKIKTPETWNVLLSQMGNTHEAWEHLLDRGKVTARLP